MYRKLKPTSSDAGWMLSCMTLAISLELLCTVAVVVDSIRTRATNLDMGNGSCWFDLIVLFYRQSVVATVGWLFENRLPIDETTYT